jgi:hypothetical protein
MYAFLFVFVYLYMYGHIITINVKLILKVREILFCGKEMSHKVLCPRQKNNLLHFQNQKYIGILVS